MRHLTRLASPFIRALKSSFAHSYVQARLMSTKAPLPPSKLADCSKHPACNSKTDADIYRKRLKRYSYDRDAIYQLAVCIGQGIPIHASDTLGTRFQGQTKVCNRDLEAELYRKALRFNPWHTDAILGLAKCIKNGTLPQKEDLATTWLQGGNWDLKDSWGLSKPVIKLLVQALEDKAKLTQNCSQHHTLPSKNRLK